MSKTKKPAPNRRISVTFAFVDSTSPAGLVFQWSGNVADLAR